MSNLYHIHIYKVNGKLEFDLFAKNPTLAKEKALKLAKKMNFKQSDCNHIALDFSSTINPDPDLESRIE